MAPKLRLSFAPVLRIGAVISQNEDTAVRYLIGICQIPGIVCREEDLTALRGAIHLDSPISADIDGVPAHCEDPAKMQFPVCPVQDNIT